MLMKVVRNIFFFKQLKILYLKNEGQYPQYMEIQKNKNRDAGRWIGKPINTFLFRHTASGGWSPKVEP